MIQLLTEEINSRIVYLCTYLSGRWGVEVSPVKSLSTPQQLFFSYGAQHTDAVFHIPSSGYLKEGQLNAKVKIDDGHLFIDGVNDELAAIFYLLTGAETYTNLKRDEHGRFLSNYSNLPGSFYQVPFIDQILMQWKDRLVETGQVTTDQFQEDRFQIEPTFDIDVAYAYGDRPLWRSLGSRIKDVLKRDRIRIKERKEVKAGAKKDPYDTFDAIEEVAQSFPVKMFILVGDYGKFDKNLEIGSSRMKELIERFKNKLTFGLHPSYKSSDLNILKKEKLRLEKVMKEKVAISRQHFLKLELPETYSNLDQVNIRHDYTMGFPDLPGFRMGTCFPFPFYNLTTEKASNLTVHPLIYMDGTLKEYMNLEVSEAIEEVKKLKAEVQQVNGVFSFLWHNDTINNSGEWNGWRLVLEESLSV